MLEKFGLSPNQCDTSSIVACFNKCLQTPLQFHQILKNNQTPTKLHVFDMINVLVASLLRRLSFGQPIVIQDKYQRGFEPNEHFHTLCQLQQSCELNEKSFCCCLIDLQNRAFPENLSMSLKELVKNGNQEGTQQRCELLHQINRHLHEGGEEVGTKNTEALNRISIFHHNFVLDKLLTAERAGFDINGRHLSHLTYGHTLYLIATSPYQLNQLIKKVRNEVYSRVYLGKIHVLLGRHCEKLLLPYEFTNDPQIVIVDHITCHDKILYADSSMKSDSTMKSASSRSQKIADAKNTSLHLRTMSQSTSVQHKKHLFLCDIVDDLIEDTQFGSVSVSEMKMINEILMELYDEIFDDGTELTIEKINDVIRANKLGWVGHVMRREDTRWCKRVTLWAGQNGRITQWHIDIIEELGANWPQRCQDRKKWHRIVKKLKPQEEDEDQPENEDENPAEIIEIIDLTESDDEVIDLTGDSDDEDELNLDSNHTTLSPYSSFDDSCYIVDSDAEIEYFSDENSSPSVENSLRESLEHYLMESPMESPLLFDCVSPRGSIESVESPGSSDCELIVPPEQPLNATIESLQ